MQEKERLSRTRLQFAILFSWLLTSLAVLLLTGCQRRSEVEEHYVGLYLGNSGFKTSRRLFGGYLCVQKKKLIILTMNHTEMSWNSLCRKYKKARNLFNKVNLASVRIKLIWQGREKAANLAEGCARWDCSEPGLLLSCSRQGETQPLATPRNSTTHQTNNWANQLFSVQFSSVNTSF